MKKLENKVFLVLFFILTLFLLTILFIFNYQDYTREKNDIRSNLMRIEDKPVVKPDINGFKYDNQKIFMDMTVYTIIYDENNDITQVISHSNEDSNNSNIYQVANDLLEGKNKKDINIGNLYFDEYSYSFKKNNTLVIIDNQRVQERLISVLKTSIVIFVLLEVIILYVSMKLTKWIIKPVIESFDKQKQFITDASHELKTPLSVIMASADALENDANEKKWLNNIKSESERMSKLVTNLLDLARLENGVNKEEYSETNLSKLVEMSVLTFEGIIYEKNIKLNYNIEETLNIVCSSEQIKQLMAILIDNAIKHSIKDGEINIDLRKEKNEYIIEVKNKGAAIPKSEEEKIFERFYRVDESRNRDENRYGLGLAIAKNIVLNHNGKISAKSNNDYTTFRVLFKKV